MALLCQVKAYLAQWFQLGKKAVSRNSTYCPRRVFFGESYSAEFEADWRQMLTVADEVYLEGTEESLADLLTGAWDIESCARCEMPVPTSRQACSYCPCSDMKAVWPNDSLPRPRVPADTQAQLQALCSRLRASRALDFARR
ncbi:MAG: hypothetical protein ACFB9N_08085 [Geitlerinemataceae cyanobacterium]